MTGTCSPMMGTKVPRQHARRIWSIYESLKRSPPVPIFRLLTRPEGQSGQKILKNLEKTGDRLAKTYYIRISNNRTSPAEGATHKPKGENLMANNFNYSDNLNMEALENMSIDECMEVLRGLNEKVTKEQEEAFLKNGGKTCGKCGRAYPADFAYCPFCDTADILKDVKAKKAGQ